MAGVLTTSSIVQCGHKGSVATTGSAKLTVAGATVLIHPDSIAGKSVSGCTTPAGSTTKPCTSVSSVTTGASLKLTLGGKPAALDSLAGQTDGIVGGTTPQPMGSAAARQTKLSAV